LSAGRPDWWNRLRYTFWARFYDRLVAPVGFEDLRRRSIEHLRLGPGDSVLIVGAGTGLDLPYFPPGIAITATDVTPAMLNRLERRAADLGLTVAAQVLDARQLPFADEAFDAVVMHLVLAVMADPERGLVEAARVLKPGGRIAVFDKFLGDDQLASWRRRLLNLVAKPTFSDMNRRLGPLVQAAKLTVERDEPAAFGGMYRLATLRKGVTGGRGTHAVENRKGARFAPNS
jgi:ubiquinone/menaquinone biosynthesis C-methylase UbiE